MGAQTLTPHLEQRPQKIIHIDMDCFFAAVEELDNPKLKGKPVAVGGSPTGRGVLCTANYEARKYGVKSAMSSAEAIRRCPQLIFIRPRSKRYSEVSAIIREVFEEVTPQIQPLSLDEAYLDVTNCEIFNGSATLIAKYIKEEIFKRTGLTASAGVAPNLFLAKIASDWKKPNGLFVIGPDETAKFAKDLPLKKVPGIGKVTEERLNFLWEELEERYERHCKKRGPSTAQKIFVKVKTHDFNNHSLERTLKFLEVAIEKPEDLKKVRSYLLDTTKEMFKELYERIDQKPLRLLGLGLRLATSPCNELEKLGQLRLL